MPSKRTTTIAKLKELIKDVETRKSNIHDFESIRPVNCSLSMINKTITCDVKIFDLESNLVVKTVDDVMYTFDQLGFKSG